MQVFMKNLTKKSIFWFRRDLRLHDNAGLYHALKESKTPVLCLFIFDTTILGYLDDKKDARVTFLYDTLTALQQELRNLGSDLVVKHGKPIDVWNELVEGQSIASVYTNKDWETTAIQRDTAVAELLAKKDIPFNSYKDHVIFEKGEITKDDGLPYTIFTPYSRKWLAKLQSKQTTYVDANTNETHPISFYLKPYPNEKYFSNLLQVPFVGGDLGEASSNSRVGEAMPSLQDLDFERSSIAIPSKSVAMGLIKKYDTTRDFPAISGTSKLGIHFRFGTISIREKAYRASLLNATYLNELIWRDFYATILAYFPHVERNAFRPAYDNIAWRDDETAFQKWCDGNTGYPLVDAGMRELNATGFMHNRVRMVVASFLSKHLLLDWRLGEAYFAKKLLDFDLASNSGGWQWAAGCGTDAAPYFRVFNPEAQQQKFDKDFTYIKRWIPEYGTVRYAKPMVEHKFARERCLVVYKEGLNGG
jgi:deoxyribodipyrimidine photo-lyase